MCLIVVAWQQHPEFDLVVAANRDEYFQRPAQSAHWWETPCEILAGKDLQAGGSWLGVNRAGRFAAVTNIRDPSEWNRPWSRSRGELVVDALCSAKSPETLVEDCARAAHEYAGYNLLVADGGQLAYFNNRSPVSRPLLPAGVYGVSNGLLDTPWPKVEAARAGLERQLQEPDLSVSALQALMANTQVAEQGLPDTGVGPALEKQLSPIRILPDTLAGPTRACYGTRCTTVVLCRPDGSGVLVERRFDETGAVAGETEWEWPSRSLL